MGELELLRSLPFEIAAPDEEARARARGRLLRHIHRVPTKRRPRLLVPALGLAAAIAIAALLGVENHGGGSASAAPVLRRVATVARTQPAPIRATAGHFLYTKSVVAYTSGGKGWTALGPGVRETWFGPNGGFVHEVWGKPVFLSVADRKNWIAAGRPQVNPPEDSAKLPPERPLNLPRDPDALYAKLYSRALGHGNGTEAEMFTLVADALRDTDGAAPDSSPALRAALYEVAARLPRVELVGPATDRVGRHGVAVAYVDSKIHERHELIFDTKTSALLGEEYVQLDGNPYGYPAGTVTGYATYVTSAVVNRLRARP
jgi:hypothetical protein